jgi:fructokinase
MSDIVALGELLVDMFPAETGRPLDAVSAFRPAPGGAPANAAVAVARLGGRSAFVGKVGDDPFGRSLAALLAREGVETHGLRFDPGARTTLAFIASPTPDHNEYLFYRNPGADSRLRPDELDRELLTQARALLIGSLSLADEPIRSAAHEAAWVVRESGGLLCLDVNYRPSLWPAAGRARSEIAELLPAAYLVKANQDELELLTGRADLEEGTARLLESGPRLCVVTLGAQGSYFRSPAGAGFVPAFRVPAVDATGCGDAFVAGLLFRLVGRGDWRTPPPADELREALRFANAVAALTSLKVGAIPALPTAAQVSAFLAERTA